MDTSNGSRKSFELKHVTSAEMNPMKQVLAISTSTNIFLINLSNGAILSKIHFPTQVIYWCWLNETYIGFISKSHDVYHWNVSEDSFSRVFKMDERLIETQITCYKSSPDGKWFSLTGLMKSESSYHDSIEGLTQIYSVDYNHVSNVIEAHTTQFTRHSFSNNTIASNVLITAKNGHKNSTSSNNHCLKVSVIELGPQKPGNHPLIIRSEVSKSNSREDDFPIGICVSKALQFVFVATKFGLLFVYDLETCISIVENQVICPDIIFHVIHESESDRIMAFGRNGQILQVHMNLELLLHELSKAGSKRSVAMRINLLSSVRDQVTRL